MRLSQKGTWKRGKRQWKRNYLCPKRLPSKIKNILLRHSAVRAGYAFDVAASPSKNFVGKN